MNHRTLCLVLLASAILLVVSVTACQAVVYVKADSTGPWDGNSWATAYRNLEQGINDAKVAGEEVWAAAGTYSEMVDIYSTSIGIYGGFRGTETGRDQRDWIANPTVVCASGSYAFYMQASPTIDGFTITNGQLMGVYNANGSPTIRNCRIVGNGTGVLAGSSIVLENCVIARNTTCGVKIQGGNSHTLVNNTIVDNPSPALDLYYQQAVFRNNIIAYNTTGFDNESYYATMEKNCVFGNDTNYGMVVPHPTDINADPKFRDRAHGDYRLLSASPCVDSGTTTGAPASDCEGYTRPQDGDGDGTRVPDIGAHEYQLDLAKAKATYADGTLFVAGDLVVTGVFPTWTSALSNVYAERPDQSGAIRILTVTTAKPGDRIEVTGVMAGDQSTGERYVTGDLGTQVIRIMGGTGAAKPVAMTERALVGGPLGLQPGTTNGAGLNNLGMLACIYGKVLYVGPQALYIDDGSGVWDGGNYKGVLVETSERSTASVGQYIGVQGIVSCFKRASYLHRKLLAIETPLIGLRAFCMAGASPEVPSTADGSVGCLLWNRPSNVSLSSVVEYHIYRDSLTTPVAVATSYTGGLHVTPLGNFDYALTDNTVSRQFTYLKVSADHVSIEPVQGSAQGISPGRTYNYWISCVYRVLGQPSPYYVETKPVYAGRLTAVKRPQISSPGDTGGTQWIDIANITFRWRGVAGADQYRIEVYPNGPNTPDNMWAVDIDQVTDADNKEFTRTFTDVLNQSPELSSLPNGTVLYWRVGARFSGDKLLPYPAGPRTVLSGPKNSRWIYGSSTLSFRKNVVQPSR